MSGGAVGSLLAQWMHVTDVERTTLLVAGAAAGMSAPFAPPFAAIPLAVHLPPSAWRPTTTGPRGGASEPPAQSDIAATAKMVIGSQFLYVIDSIAAGR